VILKPGSIIGAKGPDMTEQSDRPAVSSGSVEYERDLLARVVQSSLNGIMALKAIRNDDGEIADFEWLLVNFMAEQMLGRSQQDLLGARLLEVVPGDRENGLFDRYVSVVESGQSMEHEHHFGDDDHQGWFRITGVKLDDGIVVTFGDITEYK